MQVIGAISSAVSTRPFYFKDASTLSGWTSTTSVTTTVLQGRPGPAIVAQGGQYAYTNVTQSCLGKTVSFDIKLIESGAPLANFYFGCDINGRGQMIRLDGRTASYSGFAVTRSWTSWDAPSYPTVSQGLVTTGVWYNVRITIDKTGTDIEWYLNDVWQGSMIGFVSNGNYIAVHGDGAGTGGGYFDNIKFFYRDL
jgi:hypothetical protein